MKIIGIDESIGLHNCSENEEVYYIVLKSVYDEGYKKIELMNTAIDTKDYKAYGIHVHGLKSVALSIGAIDLFHMARVQELAIKEGDILFALNNNNNFIMKYKAVLNEISKCKKIMRS